MGKSKEIRLLILSARINFTEQEKDEFARLVKGNIDWHYFITACMLNDIPFLFLSHVITNGLSNQINRALLEYLNLMHIGFGYKYDMHLEQLKKLCKLFNGNLDYAVIKGISIIDKLYKNHEFCLRPFGDIDLLVSIEDTDILKNILQENGYIQGEFDIDKQKVREATRKEIVYWKYSSHQLCTFAKAQLNNQYDKISKVSIDINTTIFEGGIIKDKITAREILKHTKKNFINEKIFYNSLELEYDLLQLSYHCYKDLVSDYKRERQNDFSLLKFCDIRELINKFYAVIDWFFLIDIICVNDICYQIYFVLNLLIQLYPDMQEKLGFILCNIKPNDDSLLNGINNYINNNIFLQA